ncbi:MAG: hypothetical protein ABH840_01150 [Nanoarchaeota archaeon]
MRKQTSEVEKILHEELIKLADKIPGTEAVYRGNDPEEQSMIVYYLLIPGECNLDITDSITEAEVSLSMKFPNLDFSIMRWPIQSSQASEYPFLGKCLYQK